MLSTLRFYCSRNGQIRECRISRQLDGGCRLRQASRGTIESVLIVVQQVAQSKNAACSVLGGRLADAAAHNIPDWKRTLFTRALTGARRTLGRSYFARRNSSASVLTSWQGARQRSPCIEISGLAKELKEFCRTGQLDAALDVLKLMESQSKSPAVSVYQSLLRACTKRKSLAHVKRVYAHLVQLGLESRLGEDVFSALVKSGGLRDALHVFERLPRRSAASWTALICGYAMSGKSQNALKLYSCMLEDGLSPDKHTFISVLKACSSMSSITEGKRIHADVLKYGYEVDLFVGTCLVDMYGKCGSTVDAQNVFDGLPHHDVVLWTALLAAYVEQDQAEKVLVLYEQMLLEGVSPNCRTFVNLLQACGIVAEKEVEIALDGLHIKAKSLQIGKTLHAEASRRNYDSDAFVGNTLLGVYARCGRIVDAWNSFGELSQRDVVSWNVMLAAYVRKEEAEKVVHSYAQMLEEGVSPDAWTFVTVLHACVMLATEEAGLEISGQSLKVNSLAKGREIHAAAWRKSYDAEPSFCIALVSVYGKCWSIMDAECSFQGYLNPSLPSCTAMLATYVQHGQAEKAFRLYEAMLMEGVSPDGQIYGNMLQACSMLAEKEEDVTDNKQSIQVKYLSEVKAIHAFIWKEGYQTDAYLCSLLIRTYQKCRSIEDAQTVFESLHQHDVEAWNAMLAAYIQQGDAEKVLQLYQEMSEKEVRADAWTFVNVFKACGMCAEMENSPEQQQARRLEFLGLGKTIYADAWRKGHGSDVFMSNTLVSMYSKCGSILDAWGVFNGLSQGQVVSWNAMLTAFVEHGQAEKALQVYERLHVTSVSPDCHTFMGIFQACALLAEKEEAECVGTENIKVRSLKCGKAIHAHAWSKGCDLDVFVANSLIAMYGKCRSVLDAEAVFQRLSEPDVATWNSILAAYIYTGHAEKALQLYWQMQAGSVTPDVWSFGSALRACGMLAEEEVGVNVSQVCMKVKFLEKGKAVHAHAHRKGCVSDFVGSILVIMYGKCGSILDAKHVFDGLSKRNVVIWNAMLSVCVLLEQREMALQLYKQMQREGIRPNEITLICILRTCVGTGGLEICRQIHLEHIPAEGVLHPLLATTLVYAYGRCANMVDAQKLFDAQTTRNVVLWNSLLAGYVRQGDSALSQKCFNEMRRAGVKPNGVTFLLLLTMCSHSGLVDEGLGYFESMNKEHGLTPDIQHYGCIVDLFGRAGFFTEVGALLAKMPMEPDLHMLLCLLGSCQKHGQVLMGRNLFDRAMRLQPQHASAYILMANIYADAELWECAKEVNQLRLNAGAWKEPGRSCIEHEESNYNFEVRETPELLAQQLHDLTCRLPNGAPT